MLPDAELLAGFESQSLPAFPHADHVRVAALYLARYGRHEGLERFTAGIRRLAAAEGDAAKYHATVTHAWIELIAAARAWHQTPPDAAALLDACPRLLDPALLDVFYTRACLQSDLARRTVVPPDRAPLGWPPPGDAARDATAGPHNDRMLHPDPFTAFREAAARAAAQQVDTAPVALATASRDGRPSARMVLLRGADPRGFAFFTNYDSRKARELTENPHAALCIHWPSLEEQIRIEGRVERLPDDESDAYFAGRPRGSQIGAWASSQSDVLPSRAVLEDRYRAIETRFAGRAVDRPPFWGGFRLVPDRVEFWHGRSDRLHDRLVYILDGTTWRTETLFP